MIAIISPAKTLDFSGYNHPIKETEPEFDHRVDDLINILNKKSVNELEKLMKISSKLANLNYQRFQNFLDAPKKPAILAYKGDVYEPLEVDNFTQSDFDYLEKHLRIISGLYGVLKPSSLIKPYRLEMSIKVQNQKGNNLYQFWNDDFLNYFDNIRDVIINLASDEYFSAIPTIFSNKIIKIIFKEKRANQLKIIGINAKRARGLMVNFMVKNKIENPDQLKEFDLEDYKFNISLSSNNCFVFTRDK